MLAIVVSCRAVGHTRFAKFTENEINQQIKERIPKSTRRKIDWTMKLFRTWFGEWKTRLDGGMKVYKNIEEFLESDLNFCLKYFFAEVRKENGDMYPPDTLKGIAAMIQLCFRTEHHWEFSFSPGIPWMLK